jgi:hypothetical protein
MLSLEAGCTSAAKMLIVSVWCVSFVLFSFCSTCYLRACNASGTWPTSADSVTILQLLVTVSISRGCTDMCVSLFVTGTTSFGQALQFLSFVWYSFYLFLFVCVCLLALSPRCSSGARRPNASQECERH